MSDKPYDENDAEKESGSDSPASVSGKGWDILVGGKDNPYAAGGTDPFDIAKAAAAKADDIRAKDAETDAILNLIPPQGTDNSLPPDAMLDQGRGAEAPRDLGPQELASPGLSEGVTVTPLGGEAAPPIPTGPITITEVTKPGTAPLGSSAITEIAAPEPSAPSAVSSGMLPVLPVQTPAVTPAAASGITELPPAATPAPSMPLPRTIPAANPAAPVPFVPGLVTAQSGGYVSQIAITDPFASQTDVPIRVLQDVPPDPEMEKRLITQERVNALWREINETYDLVINDVRGHFNTTESAISELAHARELLVAGTANFDEAEELVKEVKARLRLEEKVRQWSVARGTWLAAYLIIWFPLLGLAAALYSSFNEIALKFVPEFLASTFLPTIFGIFGGVIGALWILNKHITKKRDFDPIHTMWYVTNPFLGGALGVVTYFVIRGGGFLVSFAGGSGPFVMTDVTKIILCVLSMIVGFNQNILWSLIDRFLKTVIGETKEDSVAATDINQGSSGGSSSAAG
jgi:hypothetical protein